MQSINARRYAPVARTVLVFVIAAVLGGALFSGPAGGAALAQQGPRDTASQTGAIGLDRADAIVNLAGTSPAALNPSTAGGAGVDRADAVNQMAGATVSAQASLAVFLRERDRADAIAWLAGGQ